MEKRKNYLPGLRGSLKAGGKELSSYSRKLRLFQINSDR